MMMMVMELAGKQTSKNELTFVHKRRTRKERKTAERRMKEKKGFWHFSMLHHWGCVLAEPFVSRQIANYVPHADTKSIPVHIFKSKSPFTFKNALAQVLSHAAVKRMSPLRYMRKFV